MSPSRLSPMDIQSQRRNRALAEEFLRRRQRVSTNGPWQGYAPDLEHQLLDFRFARNIIGLVARSAPAVSAGEVLTHDDGWSRINNGTLPLGTDAAGVSGGGAGAIVNTDVVRLAEFPRRSAAGARTGEYDRTPIALVAGDGTTADTFSMWRINPAAPTVWARVVHYNVGNGGTAPLASRPIASRDGDAGSIRSMPDSCVFPDGAPARAAYSGAITEPAFIWTNNVDPVMVYPPATTGPLHSNYEPLTDQFGADFLAVSCETFKDRVYFLNTSESGTRYANRLRRTARFTCDPQTAGAAGIGSGTITFEEFAGQGVRCESLGDVLAVYFEDGVAIVRDTGIATAPNAYQVVERKRGLLGTHALANLGDGRHFGIFSDGWWFLDQSGRWAEAGAVASGNTQVFKWKKDFYERLDYDNRHRIQIHYDQPRRWIRISFPSVEDDAAVQPQETWIYDLDGDRVWRDRYPVTCWGEFARQITTPLLWSTATQTWSSIVGTWASLGAEFSLYAPVHGDLNGRVYGHDPDLITRDGSQPTYLFEVAPNDFEHPLDLKTVDRVSAEYVNVANAAPATLTAIAEGGGTQSGTTLLNSGNPGEVHSASVNFRLTCQHIGYRISGTGPVLLRSLTLDYFLFEGVEPR